MAELSQDALRLLKLRQASDLKPRELFKAVMRNQLEPLTTKKQKAARVEIGMWLLSHPDISALLPPVPERY